MKNLNKYTGLFLSTLLIISVLGVIPAAAGGNDQGQYIVVLEDGASPREVASDHGLAPGHVYSHALNGFTASGVASGKLNSLRSDPRVKFVEKDITLHALGQTIPTGVDRIQADQNTTADIDGVDERVDVDIAILDTGIDEDHPDLNVYAGKNFSNGPSWKYDDGNGHGTHVAGTAAAIDDKEGVVGMAPGARLWAVKVLNNSGSGSLSDIIAGIDWVTKNATEIEVANMSLGGQGQSDSFRTAIQNSVAAGVVYVVAAGNDESDVYGSDGTFETDDDFIPAAYPEVATISALADSDGEPGGNGSDTSYGSDDSFASFSNFSGSVVSDNPVSSPGAAIDLLLPGVDILSTYKDGSYATGSGTSMSSPHGAGLAALYTASNGRDTDGDGDHDAADVYAIRQALIDQGVAQDSDDGLAVLNDPDTNWERIGWASSVTGEPPTASWVNPNDGEQVSGTVTIQIDASDNEDSDDNLTVEYRIDGGSWITADYNPDTGYYEDNWGTGTVDDGSHDLDVRATDSNGNASTDSITVDVQNTDDPPAVSWANPKDGNTVSDNVSIQIEAKDDIDNDNSLAVEWKVENSTWESSWRKAAFNENTGYYENTWDTTTVSGNDYTLTARATDSNGNENRENITVTVANETTEKPTIDKFEITEVNSPSPHVEFSVDWQVSDADGNLDTVEVVLKDSGGNTIDTETESVSGSSASGTSEVKDKFAEGSGNEYDITLTITDEDGNSASETRTVTES